jgi:L-iditol 2-dehydrogenase
LRREEADTPRPGPGEAAIDVEVVGLCASDLHYYRHGSIGGLKIGEGLVLGHEFSGRIAEIGPPATPRFHDPSEAASLEIGQRVTAEPGRPCGACRECDRGDYHLCRSMRFFGTPPADGAFQDRVICPAEWIFPLPDTMTTPEGAMMEPLAVGVFAAELAELKGGESCAVVGCGAIGLATLQALKASGAGPVAVEDPILHRTEMAKALGAADEPPVPHSLEVVAECAGTPEAVSRAIELARPGGRAVIVGIPDDDAISFSASAARRKGLTLKFSRRYRHCFPRSIRWTAEGETKVAPFLTHRFSLDQAEAAFDLAIRREGGVLRAWIDMTL